MNYFRQPIALFGFVLPIVITIAVIAGALMIKGSVTRSFNEKFAHYRGFEQNKRQALAAEAEISKKREYIERWEALVSEETASAVTLNLREIEELLPAKEFQKTAQDHPSGEKVLQAHPLRTRLRLLSLFAAPFGRCRKPCSNWKPACRNFSFRNYESDLKTNPTA